MSTQHSTIYISKFIRNIPLIYDTVFGPVAFDHYGKEIAKAAAELEKSDVLEIAAGTGSVSRRLRDVMQDDFRLVAIELTQDMLDFARTKFTADESVVFASADAMINGTPMGGEIIQRRCRANGRL